MHSAKLFVSVNVCAARKFVAKNPQTAAGLEEALRLLSIDASDSRLKTHKLKGPLKGSWACAAGYDCRIVFGFVQHQRKEAILLETIGTHDEVY